MKTAQNSLKILLPFTLVLAVAVFVAIRSFSAPNTEAIAACGANSTLTGEIDIHNKVALIGNQEIIVPQEVIAKAPVSNAVLGSAAVLDEKWIEVDLSEQKLRAWDGNDLYLETAISSGLPRTPTPTGEFRIWIKLRATKMEGGEGSYYYNLPNVPYVMFFSNDQVPAYKGYGLHGTYWHNDFGNPRSHGCVNLPTNIAEKLYHWTSPEMGEEKYVTRSTSENLGTRIIIHK